MFTIKKVDLITSQTGRGIRIGNVVLGCARIVEVELPEDVTLLEVAKADGLTLPYSLKQPTIPDDEIGEEGEKAVVEFDEESILNGSNYVLVTINENDEVEVVGNWGQITDLFELPASDAENLKKNISKLAESRNLFIKNAEDLEGNSFFFFVNQFDEEILGYHYDDDADKVLQTYMALQQSREYLTEISTHNFIKMLLVGLVKTSQDRYNDIHRDKVLLDAAKLISGIRYWNDGNLLKPSIKDVEDFITEIKNRIVIE